MAVISLLIFFLGLTIPYLYSFFAFDGYIEEIGLATKVSQNYFVLLTRKGSFYVAKKEHGVFILDLVKVKGYSTELEFNHYEGGFNFRIYLNHLNVDRKLTVKGIEKIFSLNLDLNSYREWVLFHFNEQRDIADGLLFFKTTSLNEEMPNLQRMGLLTTIFSCGIHVSSLLRFLRNLLEKKFSKISVSVTISIAPLFFLFCSGFSFSGIRITLTALIWLSFSLTKRKVEGIDSSLLSFFVLLAIYPYYSLESSFWIPFLLILAYRLIKPILNGKNSLKKKLTLVFSRSFVLVPVRLFTHGTYGIIGIFLSPLLISIGSLLFLLVLPCYVFPVWGKAIRLPLFLMEFFLSAIGKVGALSLKGTFPLWLLLIWFLLGITLSIVKTLKFKTVYKAIMFSFLPILLTPTFLTYFPKDEIHFIDVGQGSSSLIRYGGKNVLIDTGGSIYMDLATECLIPYFEKIGVSHLDAVLLTHGDNDHDGALESLKRNFEVREILYGEESEEEFYIGGLKFKNLNCSPTAEDENERSGVFLFEAGKKRILFMGDASKEVERRVLLSYPELKANVLVVGHHGSNTSSGFLFLQSIDPKLCVISVGEGNKYGHPHKEVIANIESLGLEYHRTDKKGTLVYSL